MKMGKKKKNYVSLLSNSVDIDPIRLLIEKTKNFPIYRARFGIDRFDFERTRIRNRRDQKIEIRFIKEIDGEGKKIIMEAKLTFTVGYVCFTVYVSLWVKADYEQNRYDILMEDFLYTYLCHLIEGTDMIQRRKEIHLPETLQVYYESNNAWRTYQVKDYVILGFESEDVTLRRFIEPKIPSILAEDNDSSESLLCERIYG